jgi:hypothetical protein
MNALRTTATLFFLFAATACSGTGLVTVGSDPEPVTIDKPPHVDHPPTTDCYSGGGKPACAAGDTYDPATCTCTPHACNIACKAGTHLTPTCSCEPDPTDPSNPPPQNPLLPKNCVQITADAAHPTLVSTPADLAAVGTSKNAYYKLANDIDMAGIDFKPVGLLNGVFDGGGHTISNLSINAGTYGYYGLFKTTSCAVIRDLDLATPSVTMNDSSCTGIVVGLASDTNVDRVTISNGHMSGVAGYSAGGVIGCAYGTTGVGNVSADVLIDLPTSGNDGGLVGLSQGTGASLVVAQSEFKGSITARACVGGILGGSAGGGTGPSNYDTSILEISGATMSGSVTQSGNTNDTGGIVGCTLLSKASIKSSTVTGTVSGPGAAGILGHSYQPQPETVPTLAGNTWPNGLQEVVYVETTWR